jgi:hypothetical protein
VALLLDSLANIVLNSIKYKLLLILRNYKFARDRNNLLTRL